jgi:hypothetical protein
MNSKSEAACFASGDDPILRILLVLYEGALIVIVQDRLDAIHPRKVFVGDTSPLVATIRPPEATPGSNESDSEDNTDDALQVMRVRSHKDE